MDIFAHTLWAGVGIVAARRHLSIAPRTIALTVLRRSLWIPLLGWWSHIIIDVFTHSADYYPSPVLYPFTQAGFDGIAWNTPWFMVLNYVALGTTGWWLWRSRASKKAINRYVR